MIFFFMANCHHIVLKKKKSHYQRSRFTLLEPVLSREKGRNAIRAAGGSLQRPRQILMPSWPTSGRFTAAAGTSSPRKKTGERLTYLSFPYIGSYHPKAPRLTSPSLSIVLGAAAVCPRTSNSSYKDLQHPWLVPLGSNSIISSVSILGDLLVNLITKTIISGLRQTGEGAVRGAPGVPEELLLLPGW